MKRINFLGLTLLMAIIVLPGCKKVFDIKPQDQLDVTNAYQNVYDADAAVVGIYGKFMTLADRYVILNELRGDLLNYTNNANESLRQISTHTVTAGNPYASPRPFYELILNCNDALEHFQVMVQEKRMTEDEFNQRYSDIGALRSFLFLQMGIHFGEVPYVTSSLTNVDAVKDPSNFPKLSFPVLLDSLIRFTEALPSKELYPSGTNLNISVDGYPTQKFYINKKVILGDLHLWKGNFVKAAEWYRQVMETGTQGTVNGNYYTQYKLGWDSNGDIDHYVTYSRAGDASTLVYNSQWRIMFEQAFGTAGFDREWVWALPFDSKFKPDNSLIKLFSPIGGDYLVKPSNEIYNLWDNETQRAAQGGSIPYDARKLLSTSTIGGQPVAMKYLYNYLNYNTLAPASLLTKNGKWFLFRQTHLHMRFAEAANRAGKYRLSWGFLNSGIAGAYPAPTSDVTLYHNSLGEPYPFNFDGRNSGSSGVPYYRSDWYRNIGIRARANLMDITVPAADSLLTIENALIKETALENAFEGTRWPDLVRVALRRNDPSFLADKIYNKLLKDGTGDAAAVRTKLMNPSNWYLPFNW
ncbi:MAG TPA: RagB/SusD family nutrient uptake outer membrane protein [Chitinophagaceae bacterium]|nr:RagB/SusD family nutrient uptake outer membrane protein [Chitinophagaceae bacterium]